MRISSKFWFCASLALWSLSSVADSVAQSVDARAYRSTKAFMAGSASDPAARGAFFSAVDRDVRSWNGALRAAIEDESKLRGLDPRAVIYTHLHAVALDTPNWSGPEWDEVRAELSRNMTHLLEHWNQGNKHLQQIVEIKLALNAFTADDLPFLTRTYLGRYTHTLTEPWLRLMAEARPADAADLVRRLDQRDVPLPLVAYALAYDRGWATNEVAIKRLIRSIPGEITGEDMASTRRTYRQARMRGEAHAEELRSITLVLLTKVLNDLHVAIVAEDPAAAPAFRAVRYLAKPKRSAAYERAIDLVEVAMRTGRGIDAMSDVARTCGHHLAE